MRPDSSGRFEATESPGRPVTSWNMSRFGGEFIYYLFIKSSVCDF